MTEAEDVDDSCFGDKPEVLLAGFEEIDDGSFTKRGSIVTSLGKCPYAAAGGVDAMDPIAIGCYPNSPGAVSVHTEH